MKLLQEEIRNSDREITKLQTIDIFIVLKQKYLSTSVQTGTLGDQNDERDDEIIAGRGRHFVHSGGFRF